MPRTWGRLLAIGAKESEPYRRIELDLPEVAIGRGEGSYERIADNTISSTHCRITVRRTPADVALDEEDDDDDVVPIVPRLVAEVWIEDCSANGTFLNSQRLGKGKSARLTQNDEIGFINHHHHPSTVSSSSRPSPSGAPHATGSVSLCRRRRAPPTLPL